MYVAPQHRQSGVFTALYRHIEQLAEEEPGVCGMRLYVDKHNSRATDTYHRLGMYTAHYDMLEIEL